MYVFLQPVTCIAISPSNQYFACGSEDCSVRLYELNTGKVSYFITNCLMNSFLCKIYENLLKIFKIRQLGILLTWLEGKKVMLPIQIK